MKGGRKRRRGDGPEVAPAGSQAGEAAVLGEEARPEEARVVGRQVDGHAGGEKPADGVDLPAPKGARRRVRRQADVQRDPPADEAPKKGRVVDRADAVRDPDGAKVLESVRDGVRAAPFPGVDQGSETQGSDPGVDVPKRRRRNRRLVSPEPEAGHAVPRDGLVLVEYPVGDVRTPVPDRVEEHQDPAPAPALPAIERGLEGRDDTGPRQADPLDDGGRDVHLGVARAVPGEAPDEIARQESVVGGVAQQAADVAVEGEERLGAPEPPPATDDRVDVGEEGLAVAPRERDQGPRGDRPFEVKVELGLGAKPETGEDARDVGGEGHAPASYSRPASATLPPERLWMRGAALGIDLVLLAGVPLLTATVIVFAVLLVVEEPPVYLAVGFRIAQAAFVGAFLVRDARAGLSPGKRLLGLRVQTRRGPATLGASLLRNATLLIPLWNVVEAVSLIRRGERPGDRLAGTTVVEV